MFLQILLCSKVTQSHSFLCCTAGPHCPSIANITVCIPKPQNTHPSHSLLSHSHPGSHKSALLFSDLFLFFRWDHLCYILDSTNKCNVWYLSFPFWLTSLSMRISSFIHVAVNGISLSFYGWGVFHCIYVPYLLNSFICQWTFRLFPFLGYSTKKQTTQVKKGHKT